MKKVLFIASMIIPQTIMCMEEGLWYALPESESKMLNIVNFLEYNINSEAKAKNEGRPSFVPDALSHETNRLQEIVNENTLTDKEEILKIKGRISQIIEKIDELGLSEDIRVLEDREKAKESLAEIQTKLDAAHIELRLDEHHTPAFLRPIARKIEQEKIAIEEFLTKASCCQAKNQGNDEY